MSLNPLTLPSLQKNIRITDEDGQPSQAFHQWWQEVVKKLKTVINTLQNTLEDVVEILTRLGIIEVLANGAITSGTFVIKADKVQTASMTDNAATVISSLFYNNAGGTVGTAGSYVDIPGGPAMVSIATGTKASQQCFIDAWIGVRRGGGANEMVTFRCMREDATILAQTYTQEATNDQSIMPMAFLDPAPVENTSHTYTIQINTSDTTTQIREVFVKGLLGKTG